MSTAHLHAVPDPGPGDEPEPGDWPVPADAGGQEPEELVDSDELGEDDEDEPERRRALAVPDLRPYVDVRPLAELGTLAVEAGRHGGPPALRALGRAAKATGRAVVISGRGTGVLLVLLAGWLAGQIGKRGSIGARAGGAAFAAYAVEQLSVEFPPLTVVFAAVLVLFAVLAAGGHLTPAPKKAAGKKDAADKKEPPVKHAAPAKARGGLRARLADRLRGDAKTPAQPSPEGSGQAPEEPAEEAVADPSPEALIRALHHLVQGGRGVLHTTLAQHLGLPDTGPVKSVLDETGIRRRPGVRSVAGNGPGVHRQDFPPLPPAQGDPQGTDVAAGQEPTPTPTTPSPRREEGFAVGRTDWSPEEIGRGFRSVPDPDGGPSASRIERYHNA